MNTFALRDANLSGPVVWIEDTTSKDMAEYINDRAGSWFDPTGQGDMVLSEEWLLEVFVDVELDDITDLLPDHSFTALDMEPLADLVRWHVDIADSVELLEVMAELVDDHADTPETMAGAIRAMVKEHIETSRA